MNHNFYIKREIDSFIGLNFPNGYTVIFSRGKKTDRVGFYPDSFCNDIEVFVYFGGCDVSNKFLNEQIVISSYGNKRKKKMEITETRLNHFLTSSQFVELVNKVNSAAPI